MQGRLLPKIEGKFQAHPKNLWNKEFFLAKQLGLDCIEFIIDLDEINKNPVLQDINLIKNISQKSNIEVYSVCMDFLMEAPIFKYKSSLDYIYRIVENIKNTEIKYLNLPCVDNSRLKNNDDINEFIFQIKKFEKVLYKNNINICIETDLEPKAFNKLIRKINSKNIGINYDTGNSASLGYNLEHELKEYGELILSIHIKDRVLGGGSVFLGEGDADFEKFVDLINIKKFSGPIIFQAYRDEDGLNIFKDQLKWFNSKYQIL